VTLFKRYIVERNMCSVLTVMGKNLNITTMTKLIVEEVSVRIFHLMVRCDLVRIIHLMDPYSLVRIVFCNMLMYIKSSKQTMAMSIMMKQRSMNTLSMKMQKKWLRVLNKHWQMVKGVE
jgi:hypothetical protein